MTVIRIKKNRNFTVMSNYHLRDINISLKAKGLISQMLSLPDDWDYSIKGLSKINKESQGSIKAVLKEIKQEGYLTVDKLNPDETDNGRFKYEYTLYEVPPKTRDEKQQVVFQQVEKQQVEKQQVENCLQINKEETKNEKQNTDKQITECNVAESAQPSFRQTVFDFFESSNLNGSPEKFIGYYSEEYLRRPESNWQLLACRWSSNEYVDLPIWMYDENTMQVVFSELENRGEHELVKTIQSELESSGCYQIKSGTKNKLEYVISKFNLFGGHL